jgi:hypothetical protein
MADVMKADMEQCAEMSDTFDFSGEVKVLVCAPLHIV